MRRGVRRTRHGRLAGLRSTPRTEAPIEPLRGVTCKLMAFSWVQSMVNTVFPECSAFIMYAWAEWMSASEKVRSIAHRTRPSCRRGSMKRSTITSNDYEIMESTRFRELRRLQRLAISTRSDLPSREPT